jgi:hypothetical protein
MRKVNMTKENKTEAVTRFIREYAEAHDGAPPAAPAVMEATGASRNLVWTCTSILRQTGVVTTSRVGRRYIDRNDSFSKIAEYERSYGRELNVGEVKSLFGCSYATARKLQAEYRSTLS